ncbi:hypothetical protein K431DRAFT_339874 [Polychaeton citri CBS 116435]|uniref:DUF1989 domain-containing protein n=1 Tax=Polychaeton citri CBS 116435 TaxID=1314669 RepID=A0A9P4UMJ8_9PEZI|nr:hypothetical protein K431DRAFT_339874 [Polychaeton citri CBS 116435]
MATENPRYFEIQPQPPVPAYQASPGSILHTDRQLYDDIANAKRELVEQFTLPIRSGRAWTAPAGHIVRFGAPEGPKVGDVNIWDLHNLRERFWASRTRQLHASHSCLPYLQPMATILRDSLGGAYGVGRHGGQCHDLLGTRCDLYCHSNLTRAVVPHSLTEFDVYDASLAASGDFLEFFAEIDCLFALSTCPGGDLSAWGWGEGASGSGAAGGEGKSMLDCRRPLKVEMFKVLDDGVLGRWKQPKVAGYKGMHGMGVPLGERNGR